MIACSRHTLYTVPCVSFTNSTAAAAAAARRGVTTTPTATLSKATRAELNENDSETDTVPQDDNDNAADDSDESDDELREGIDASTTASRRKSTPKKAAGRVHTSTSQCVYNACFRHTN